MHLTVLIYGYNTVFENSFDMKALDWDVLYNAVSTYWDADYFDYIDSVEAEPLNQYNGNVIILSKINEVAYCGEGTLFDEWDEVKYIGSIDVHC